MIIKFKQEPLCAICGKKVEVGWFPYGDPRTKLIGFSQKVKHGRLESLGKFFRAFEFDLEMELFIHSECHWLALDYGIERYILEAQHRTGWQLSRSGKITIGKFKRAYLAQHGVPYVYPQLSE